MQSRQFVLIAILSLTRFSYACDIPVCNVAEKIEELRNVTQDARVQFYTELLNQYKTNRNTLVLENLIDFSLEAYKLSIELDSAEAWIPQRAANLLNRSLTFALTQGPIQVSKYSTWYANFISDSAPAFRFQVLLYWNEQLKNDSALLPNDLRQLISFMGQARSISEFQHDENYVMNLAQSTATQAGLQLLRISPQMEGVYQVEVKCAAIDINHCPKLDKFSIVLGDRWRLIQAAFIDETLIVPVFEFTDVHLIDEKTVEGQTGPLDTPFIPASFYIEFDQTTKSFSGFIRTPRTLEKIEIRGSLIVSPINLMNQPRPTDFISPDKIEGAYTGNIARPPGAAERAPQFPPVELMIVRYDENSFKATLRDGRTHEMLFDFPAGYYFRNIGLITLYGADPNGLVKLTFAYRLVAGVPTWIGLVHSLRTGQYYFLNLNAKL